MSWKKITTFKIIPDSGEDIVNKINNLSIDTDFQIDKEHIKGLEEGATIVKNGLHFFGGGHSLTIKGLGVTIDKNTRVINFTGSAITSVTRSTDGVVTVNIGGASVGTAVSEETPTDSGDHINFTLAHTPIAGTFRLYRGGSRQMSISATPDFTRTGTALTLTLPLDSTNGEILLCDYSY